MKIDEMKETVLFAEKNRIYDAFSQIAGSLRSTFFTAVSRSDEILKIAAEDVLQQVLDYTRNLLCAEKCALFLVDLPETSLVLERVSGVVDFERLKDVATYDLRSTDMPRTGVTPWVLHRRKPFNARNFDELRHNSEGHWKGNWDIAMYGSADQAQSQFQCVYMVPLLAGKKSIGVLKYENRTINKAFFEKEDERIIDMIAALVTNLVISQRIERNRYDTILPTISTTLVSYFDKPPLYEELLEKCRGILSADICSLFILDDQENLMLKCIVGVEQKKRESLRGFGYPNYRSSGGLTPWILIRGTSFNVRSYPDLIGRSEDHHMGKWDLTVYEGKPEKLFKSLYSVPLKIGDERIGVFKIENKNVPPYYFTESDERLFDLIGRLIAVHVKYERARETEQYLAQMARAAELGFLAAGISHEFNNYLQRFLVTARAAQAKCKESKVSKDLEQITNDIWEASKVIDNFKTIRSREQNTKTFDLSNLIEQIIDTSKQRFVAHHVTIKFLNHGVGKIYCNPSDIQTIIINLIKNAFEAVIETNKPGSVEVTAMPGQEDQIVIQVSDSGKGIPEEDRQSIFAPFYTTKLSGMGVGLFWVQRLVNAMGGRIDIESPNAMGGATFRVILRQQAGNGVER